jgi:hypothetical protein
MKGFDTPEGHCQLEKSNKAWLTPAKKCGISTYLFLLVVIYEYIKLT